MPFKKKTSTHRLGLAFRLPQMQRKGESTASRQRGRKFWEMESSEERVGVPTQVRPDFRNTGPGPVPAHLTHVRPVPAFLVNQGDVGLSITCLDFK